MVGATACAFGTTDGDRQGLYVTTDGGMITRHGNTRQPAKLARLDVTPAAELLTRHRRESAATHA